MGKQGPCCHCGISITPLWRNGPPEKPVLCNACGSRWRIKGTLVNYMPMHSGICGTKSDAKASQGKKTSQKCKDQRSSHKRKEPCDGGADFEYGVIMPNLYASKSFDDDASTRSSTGSGISYSESCIQNFGGATRHFSAHKPVWDFAVPSKRRRPMYRGRPSIVKLARLKSFLLEPTAVEDLAEDLLVEYKAPLMDAEIGLGGIFIRPCLSLQEHESEASSLIYEAKGYNYSKSLLQSSSMVENPVHGKNKVRQIQKIAIHLENNTLPDKVALESLLYGKHDVLHDRQSPLASVDLKVRIESKPMKRDIVNFHSFSRLLTHGEQLELSRYLSSVDVWKTPERLKNLFSSPELGNALSCFQSLLSEGYFEMPSSPASHLFQELLFHTDLNASRWMDRYLKLKNAEGPSNTVKNVSPSLVSDATCGKNERVKPSCGKREEPSCGESVSIETAGAPTESSSRGNEKPYECVWEEETEVSDLLFEIPSCLSFQQPWNKPFNIQEISMGDTNTGARFSDESGLPPNSFPTPTGSGHVLPKGKKQM